MKLHFVCNYTIPGPFIVLMQKNHDIRIYVTEILPRLHNQQMFRKSSLFVNIFRWTGSFIYFRSRPWCFEVVVFFVQPMKAWMCV